jgi:hypothetical protein
MNEHVDFITNEHLEIQNDTRTIWGLSAGLGSLSIKNMAILSNFTIYVESTPKKILYLCVMVITAIDLKSCSFFFCLQLFDFFFVVFVEWLERQF